MRSKRGIAIWTVGRGFSSRRNWRAITFVHEKKFDAAANWRIAIIIADGKEEEKKKIELKQLPTRCDSLENFESLQLNFLSSSAIRKIKTVLHRLIESSTNFRIPERKRGLRYSAN